MTIDNFTMLTNGVLANIGTLNANESSGTNSVSVGATLNVGGSQFAGVYTSLTPFDVTVNYN